MTVAADLDVTRNYDKLRPAEAEQVREVRQRAYQTRNLLPLLKEVPRSAKIIEIGPGCGVTARLLREWGFQNYAAIEVCEEYVRTLQSQGFECRFAEDASKTLDGSEQDGSCGLILAIDVLEHMPLAECRRLLEVSRRKLAPGGLLVVQVPNASAPFGMNTHLADPTHVLPFNDVRLSSLFAEAGFEDRLTIPVRLPSSNANRLRGLAQAIVFSMTRTLTRAVGATPVTVMTHLMIGVGRVPQLAASTVRRAA
jgi:hypothetical protein